MTLLRIPFLALVYLSIATLLAEASVIGVVWANGNLTKDSLLQMMAVAHDVDLGTLRRRLEGEITKATSASVARREVEARRHVLSLDLSMREIAVDKGLIDIREISAQFSDQWEEYKQLKDDFDWKWDQLLKGATDQAVLDVRRQLESLSSAQAKTQILKLLNDPSLERDEAHHFVVTVFKGLPINNRKLIIEEFRVDDKETLHGILKQIRRGEPDVGLFRETRRNLQKFD